MQMDTSNRRYARDDDPRDDDLATRGDGRDGETTTSLGSSCDVIPYNL